MKVLLSVFTGDTGIGGHLYTVRAHAEALQAHAECAIVGVGFAKSKAWDQVGCQVHQILLGRDRTRLTELRSFASIVRAERPDVIHAFDPVVCALAKPVARWFGCGLVLTICGGPNPSGPWRRRLYVPRVDRLVCLSEENAEFYRQRGRHRAAQIWCIPNRVNEIRADTRRIEEIRGRLRSGVPTIVRIGRFHEFHEQTAIQCVRLIKRLVADGCRAQLLLVGAAQSQGVRNRLSEMLGSDGLIVDEPALVKDASGILDVSELAVGTGRSLMEAAARSRVLLVPVHSGQLPALVTERNWRALARTNFSGRGAPQNWDEQENYANIRRALLDSAFRCQLSKFSRSLYVKQFALSSVIPQYLDIYRASQAGEPVHPLDTIQHWLWLLWRTRNPPRPSPDDLRR